MCFQLEVVRDQNNRTSRPFHLMTQTTDLMAVKFFLNCGPLKAYKGSTDAGGFWGKKDGILLFTNLKCRMKIFTAVPIMFLITVTFFNICMCYKVWIWLICLGSLSRVIYFQVIYGFRLLLLWYVTSSTQTRSQWFKGVSLKLKKSDEHSNPNTTENSVIKVNSEQESSSKTCKSPRTGTWMMISHKQPR